MAYLQDSSWTHNDTTDGLVTIDPKLIPRNWLKTFNVVWSTVRQRISQPRWMKSVVFKSGDTVFSRQSITNRLIFLSFPPPFLASTSLFFDKLEEDNICLIVSSSFGWVQLSLNSNPKKEWSVPVCNWTGPLLLNFNESSIGETRCFSILGSLKNLRKLHGCPFS